MKLKKIFLLLSMILILYVGIYAMNYKSSKQIISRIPNSVMEKPVHLYNIDGSKNLKKPMGVIVDVNGKIYVTDSGDSKVKIFNSRGKLIDSFGKKGFASGEFNYPYGIVFTKNGDLLIADSSNLNIQEFTPDGKFVKYILTKNDGIKPGSLTIDEKGNVYASDLQNGKIIAFNDMGQIIGQIISKRPLNYPQGVLVENNLLWVADSGNYQITIIDKTGALKKNIKGNETKGQSSFSMVRGIAEDNLGRILVSDTIANQVRFMDRSGKWLFSLNDSFAYPMGIHIDKSGKIYIINRDSAQIQVYGYRR